MGRYIIICKGCNTKHGETDSTTPEGLIAKCSACGLDRIALEINHQSDALTTKEFDLFITNKRTGVTKHVGYQLSIEDLKNLNNKDIAEDSFVLRSAEALSELLKGEKIKTLLD